MTAASSAEFSAKLRGRHTPHLTAREVEVLTHLTTGKTNREIAEELLLSVSTVKAHLSAIYAKLGVSNRTEAALLGVELFPMLRVFRS
jgi:two-component system nitrate/nitrite response regulator NarL